MLERYFLVRFETLNDIRSALEEIFSPSVASLVLYEAGKKCGRRSCERVLEKNSTIAKLLNDLSKLKREEKWGKISFRDMDLKKETGKILIEDSFETMTSRNNKCDWSFFKGFLAGFLSKLFNKDITVVDGNYDKEKARREFIFASSLDLYIQETIRTRDRMIKEMPVKQEYY